MFYAFSAKKIRGLISLILLLCIGIIIAIAAINIKYPIKYWNIIKENANANGLDAAFICAVIHAESKFNAKAISHKNAKGLMQLTEATANWIAEEMELENYDYKNILDPELNIKIGSYYLKKLVVQYDSVRLALAAYNAGSGNVSKWLKSEEYSADGKNLNYIPFKETRDYIDRINLNLKIYKRLIKLSHN